MSCSESHGVWKPVSEKEELLGELGVRMDAHLVHVAHCVTLWVFVGQLQEDLYLKHYLICPALNSP